MKRQARSAIAAGCLLLASQQASAISLQFDYSFDSNNFFGAAGSVQRTLLETAGSFFSTRINDTLTAITPDANNQFNAVFFDPGTGNQVTVNNLSVAQDTLIVYAGGRSLPGSTLGQGGPGGFSIPSAQSQAFVDNAVARGQAGALGASASRTDFGPWGGALTFDTDASANWYFDDDPSTTEAFSGNDFFSVALHELGHVLGIGGADSWINQVFGGEFTGAAATAIWGSAVPLADGAHWQDGIQGLVDGNLQEAAMDPSLFTGTRKQFTDLDLAALSDIGWEVTAVPLPAAVWLFASGVMGLTLVGRRRS